MANEAKVVIGLPLADSAVMKAKTAHSIGCAIIRSGGVVTDFILKISCDIVANRTSLVKDAIERGATHILFVDYDMQFPSDTITKLLARDKDIIGVEYNKREFPLKKVLEPLNPKDVSKTEPYKVQYVGTGLLLIKLSVFEELKDQVWFSFGRDANGKTVVGEDVWFCGTARDAGFDVWVDPSVPVKHLGEFGF